MVKGEGTRLDFRVDHFTANLIDKCHHGSYYS